MSTPVKVVLVNAPFVLHGDSGIFLGLESFIEYDSLKAHFCGNHGQEIANSMLPYDTGLRYGVRAGSRWPHTTSAMEFGYTPFPFIMAYTSSYLKDNGVDAEVLDCVALRVFSYSSCLAILKEKKPDIVIIESSTPTIDIDLWMCKQCSEFAEVALAGPHVTGHTADALMAEHPYIRYFLKGEYIKSSLEMVKTRRAGIYEIDVVKDLDSIPFPDRSFPGAQTPTDGWIPEMLYPQLQMWGSKGCPYKCKFCLWPHTMYDRNVTLRDPRLIAKEIIQDAIKYGYGHVYFDDDTFNMGNERISRLCDYMAEIGLPWGVMARLDSSPLELFEKMIASGCVGMKFGVESFDPGVLDRIGKGLHQKDFAVTLSKLLKKYPRVKFHLTTMRNLPGQTEKIYARDMKILKEFGFMENNPYRTFQHSSCVPFPGTELYNEIMAQNAERQDVSILSYDGSQNTLQSNV